MTLVEILKKQGLTDEQIAVITSDMKENKIFTSAEENIDIRYGKLRDEHEALKTQHGESEKLIEQLKAGTKNSEELQGQITSYEGKINTLKGEYEQQVQALEAKLAEEQLKNAIGIALRDAKCSDTDYMAYNLQKKYGSELTLDENGKIKGIDEKIIGLKTQFPEHFAASEQKRQIDAQRLPDGEVHKQEPTSLEDAIKAQYDNK